MIVSFSPDEGFRISTLAEASGTESYTFTITASYLNGVDSKSLTLAVTAGAAAGCDYASVSYSGGTITQNYIDYGTTVMVDLNSLVELSPSDCTDSVKTYSCTPTGTTVDDFSFCSSASSDGVFSIYYALFVENMELNRTFDLTIEVKGTAADATIISVVVPL